MVGKEIMPNANGHIVPLLDRLKKKTWSYSSNFQFFVVKEHQHFWLRFAKGFSQWDGKNHYLLACFTNLAFSSPFPICSGDFAPSGSIGHQGCVLVLGLSQLNHEYFWQMISTNVRFYTLFIIEGVLHSTPPAAVPYLHSLCKCFFFCNLNNKHAFNKIKKFKIRVHIFRTTCNCRLTYWDCLWVWGWKNQPNKICLKKKNKIAHFRPLNAFGMKQPLLEQQLLEDDDRFHPKTTLACFDRISILEILSFCFDMCIFFVFVFVCI